MTLHIVDLWRYYVCCKISGVSRCTHPLYGALPEPEELSRVTRGAVIAQRDTYEPRRISQYSRTFIPPSVSLFNNLGDSVFDGVGLAGFKSRANAFLLA